MGFDLYINPEYTIIISVHKSIRHKACTVTNILLLLLDGQNVTRVRNQE